MIVDRWLPILAVLALAAGISGCTRGPAPKTTAQTSASQPESTDRAEASGERQPELQAGGDATTQPPAPTPTAPIASSAETSTAAAVPVTPPAAATPPAIEQAPKPPAKVQKDDTPAATPQPIAAQLALLGHTRFPEHVTKHDLMTDTDAFFIRYLDPTAVGDEVKDWPLVKKILELTVKLIDASTIAEHLNQAIPVGDQPAFKPVQDMVEDCARILNVKPPALFIKADPHLSAYVTRLAEPHLLVLTSSLYNRYKDRPDELRFIIGHELGHLKCGHIRCHTVARYLVLAMLGDSAKRGFKENYVAPLLVGQLLRWYRDSEMSADRAGLICVGAKPGDTAVAQKALLRLLHDTAEDVDPQKVQMQVIEFEKEPFVKIARKLQSYGMDHPFVPDRCVALDQWTLSAQYARLIQRRSGSSPSETALVIDEIEVKNLPDVESGVGFTMKCKPIIAAVYGDAEEKSGPFGKEANPKLTDLGWKFPYVPGCRLIVEVTDYNSVLANQLVGSCILSVESDAKEASSDLRLDIKKASSKLNLPAVAVKYHVENKK